MLRWLLTVVFAVVAASGALADGFSDAEKQALISEIARINSVAKSGDPVAAFDLTTPELLERAAKDAGISPEEYHAQSIASFTEMIAIASRFEVFVDADRIRYLKTRSGMPYALIPQTSTVVVGAENGVRMHTHILAFRRGGDWRLLAVVSNELAATAFDVYPELKGIEIPEMKAKTFVVD